MRFPDLLIMSINNLRRRKLRTVLTVLGVIIGTASIVVMVSLGIGLDQMFMEQLSSWGSLTTIDVSAAEAAITEAAAWPSQQAVPVPNPQIRYISRMRLWKSLGSWPT